MSAQVFSFPPIPDRTVLSDARDGDRAVMATWHFDEGFLVLSLWRGDTCVASAQLLPSQAAQLSKLIAEGLGELMATMETAAVDVDAG